MTSSARASEQAMHDLMCHSLLALLISASLAPGRTEEAKRRSVLVKFYKRALKNPRYDLVRQDIRRLLVASRNQRIDVYAILRTLNNEAFKFN